MIDRQALLKDLQRLLRTLEADLRERCDEVADVGAAVRAEYDAAKEAERTAQTFEAWRADYITQIAAAWVLSCVFARFLEDNELVDPPRIAGPGDRLRRARDEHELHFRNHPTDTDREYLLSVFDALAKLPGGRDIFGEHNAVNQQRDWLSGDAAKELLGFLQRIEPASGELIHDFTDPGWDTRFLGDLYQDLSEAAQKRYALKQTPDFVEEFILDRTLDPAIHEFGLDDFRMIDPACGSGHFLLGSFHRLFDRWCKAEPTINQRELAQRALGSVHGVDINPYAVAIARFRLLLSALRVCGLGRLADAPAYRINLACGDSLLHGSPGGDQMVFGFDPLSHAYASEDLPELRRLLSPGHYHAVVANPPYITVKDRLLAAAYRARFSACHRQYSLSVPFVQRIYALAVQGGFTGQITANSFMTREFGVKIVEEFFTQVALTHVIDTSGAYIPGHGTPTVILFGQNRPPVTQNIRAIMGVRGEPTTPSDASRGVVWAEIVGNVDCPGQQTEYVTVVDVPRDHFSKHPWSIAGGGASELVRHLHDVSEVALSAHGVDIGSHVVTGEDNCLILPIDTPKRLHLHQVKTLGEGDVIRDWQCLPRLTTIWPNSETGERLDESEIPAILDFLWAYRTTLRSRKAFGTPVEEKGIPWWALREVYPSRLQTPLTLTYAEVSTHNHFILDRGGKVFKNSAPVVKLRANGSEDEYYRLLGVLNSSVACFWLKQVCYNKGAGGGSRVDAGYSTLGEDLWESHYAFNGTSLKKFPLPEKRPRNPAHLLDQFSHELQASLPCVAFRTCVPSTERMIQAKATVDGVLQEMLALQEELDWQCYSSYGLFSEHLTYSGDPPPVTFGQRAFEIVLARQVAAGERESTWFDRHDSAPTTTIPTSWPEDYRRLVERRIEVIESNPQISLIEQPEYKRRWNIELWESQLGRALKNWLLARLEGYFDFDGRMKEVVGSPSSEGSDEKQPDASGPITFNFGGPEIVMDFDGPPPLADIQVASTARIADVAARDDEFMKVAELYRGRQDFDVGLLVTELVEDESVPLLPALRYKPAAMDKRTAWERTWELQRQEDAIDARTELPEDDTNYLTENQAKTEKQRQVGDIPVPPKYKSSDFISTGGAKYWRLRGKLDVPKERWVSFPHCEGEDQALVVAWAGYDHLQLARAIAAYFAKMQEEIGGSDDPRLVPLLGCILELVPWLKQWHNDIDPEYNMRMGDYFESFVEDEARTLGLTTEDIRNWKPPKKSGRRGRKAKTK